MKVYLIPKNWKYMLQTKIIESFHVIFSNSYGQGTVLPLGQQTQRFPLMLKIRLHPSSLSSSSLDLGQGPPSGRQMQPPRNGGRNWWVHFWSLTSEAGKRSLTRASSSSVFSAISSFSKAMDFGHGPPSGRQMQPPRNGGRNWWEHLLALASTSASEATKASAAETRRMALIMTRPGVCTGGSLEAAPFIRGHARLRCDLVASCKHINQRIRRR